MVVRILYFYAHINVWLLFETGKDHKREKDFVEHYSAAEHSRILQGRRAGGRRKTMRQYYGTRYADKRLFRA